MPESIARQWFVPGEGIDRHVITADIQRYLGNDATVRPGQGTGEQQGVQGYWIKAYRNLTNAMIMDLRADTQRWRQEQRSTGARGNYVDSSTYHQAAAGKVQSQRRERDSPSLESPYQSVPGARERMPTERRPQALDPMQIDAPAPQPDRRGYGQPSQQAQPATRGGFPQDPRAGFAPPQDSRNYPQDTMMQDTYGRPPVTSSYASDPRYAPSYPPQANDPAMAGFGRQQPQPGNYYPAAVSSPYDGPAMSGRPQDPSHYPGAQYGQPTQPGRQDHYRDAREQRPDPRDPRYANARGYDPRDPRDASDAYPSPATTISSMTTRDREPITSPPNQSMYGQPPYQTDPYGRAMPSQPSVPAGYPQPGARDNYQRDRPPPTGGDTRDARRRRH